VLVALVAGCTSLDDLSSYSSSGTNSVEVPPNMPGDAGATAMQGGSGGGGSGAGGSGAEGGSGGTSVGAGGNAGQSGEGGQPMVLEPGNGGTSSGEPEPTPVLSRFVRLFADSDIAGTPYTSVAEFSVLDAAGNAIDKTGWVASADSAETEFVGGAPAAKAIDGDPVSMWHTPWSVEANRPPHPHFLQVDMGAAHEVGGFVYLPRQDMSADGQIAEYRFYVSSDGVEWGEPVASGTLDAATTAHEVLIAR
jgi:hypothetical protein